MRLPSPLLLTGLALLGVHPPASGQSPTACSSAALPEAARSVASVRHGLHSVAVGTLDPVVPPAVAAQLAHLKDALTASAVAAMACSPADVTPESLQTTLASALHANLSDAAETVLVTTAGKDLGAYGSDLQVQVLPLSRAPRHLEINFRYGIECGDDDLLLVFRHDAGGWVEILRWDAPAYNRVSDAFGDFVLLTPLSGLPEHPNWRAVVAHGHPGCSAESHPEGRSRFDLDLLQPGPDPAHPAVVWHMDRPYRRTDSPRLATTEETLTFEMVPARSGPPPAQGKGGGAAPSASTLYRYRIDSDNKVQPIDSAPDGPASAPPAATSPQP